MAGEDPEEIWQALTVPSAGAVDRSLDATIVAVPHPRRPVQLPHISVREETPAGGGGAAASAPDLVVLRLLGEGGMGRVQLARQRSLDREVALKRPRDGASDLDAEALRAEALVTGHLEHPNIVPVHALGIDDAGNPLIIMKRVEGVAWRDLLRDPVHPGWDSREPDRDARLVWHLGILAQLCNAIAFAHSRGIVHRDMKPDNVMIGEFGEVYLIDWGVATSSGAEVRGNDGQPILIGTPAYMAPEMARGGPIDVQTDVYLLGAALHEVLTGRVKHDGSDLHAVTLQALASAPYRYGPEVPDELAELANQATSVDPGSRPAGALAFRRALLEHLRHRGSLRLCADADRALASIEADPARHDHRSIEECRFGYREALREWPDNPDGALGIRRCAIALARLELARENSAGARAALAEIADPPAGLVAELARLDAVAAADIAERARLRRLEEEADSTVGGSTRAVMVVLLCLFSTAVTLYALRLQMRGEVGPRQLITLPSSIALAALVTLLLFRKKVLLNEFSRRLIGWFFVMVILLVGNRVAGQAIGLSPSQQFTLDGVFMTAMLATGAIYGFRWIWWCAAMTALGTVGCVLMPGYALLWFGGAVSGVIFLAAFLIRRDR